MPPTDVLARVRSRRRSAFVTLALSSFALGQLFGCATVDTPGAGSGPPSPKAEATPSWQVRAYSTPLFGTRFELRLAGPVGRAGDEELDLAAAAAFDEAARIESLASLWVRDSAVAGYNAAARGAGRHAVPAELAALLRRCIAACIESGGAFDPTIGALLEAFAYYSGGGPAPPPQELAAARERVGCGVVRVEGEALVTTIDGVRLDLGGVGKGWAVDAMAGVLRGSGVQHGVISGGGSAVLAFGDEPDGYGWPFEIDPGSGLETWRLLDTAVAVSGQLSEPVFVDGRLVSHILDPRTGAPVDHSTLQVVTCADNATAADLAATTLLVLGSEASASWLSDPWVATETRAAWLTDVGSSEERGARAEPQGPDPSTGLHRTLIELRAAGGADVDQWPPGRGSKPRSAGVIRRPLR